MANSEKPAAKKRGKNAPPVSPITAPDAESTLEPERREKIARIKKALDEGTYRVNSEDVARKVIEHMLQQKK